MTETELVRIPIEEVLLNVPVRFDVNDDLGILLQAAGNSLTTRLRDQLVQRGVSFLEVSPADALALSGKKQSNKPVSSKRKTSGDNGRTTSLQPKDRSEETYCPDRANVFQAQLAESIKQLSGLGCRVDQLSNDDFRTIGKIPKGILSMLLDDSDQSISSLKHGSDEDSLAERCSQMSMLAMATGVEMGLDEQKVLLLGQSGLLHDLGLYQIEPHIRDPSASLTNDERATYRQHPSMIQDLLKNLTIASDETRIIVGQVHERPNGQGYPRGLRGHLTHPLACVLSIVDNYLSLIEDGPGRPPIQPHDAIAILLHQGSLGLLETKPLRAFLGNVTLFPIGSRVELNDGATATVMRRDGEHFATPIVRTDDDKEFTSTRDGIRSIARPIIAENSRQMRLPPSLIAEMTMEDLIAVT